MWRTFLSQKFLIYPSKYVYLHKSNSTSSRHGIKSSFWNCIYFTFANVRRLLHEKKKMLNMIKILKIDNSVTWYTVSYRLPRLYNKCLIYLRCINDDKFKVAYVKVVDKTTIALGTFWLVWGYWFCKVRLFVPAPQCPSATISSLNQWLGWSLCSIYD